MEESTVINPYYKFEKEVGITDTKWTSLKKLVDDHLKANDAQRFFAISDFQSLDLLFEDRRILNVVLSELKVLIVG